MPFVGIGVGIGRQRFASGIFAAYAARVAADGGVTEAGACVNAVSGISLNSSLLLVPSGYKSGVVYSEIPTDGDGDLTFTRASSATRVNSNGEIEVVGSGVPRLDYSQGSCPALLLEPQRTNLVTFSEQLDNADWAKTRTSISANATTSPDGTQNADLLYPSVSGLDFAFQQRTATNGTTYSQSIYVKAAGKNYCWMLYITGNVGARFDLINGAVVNNPSGNAKIQSVGNGWFRISDVGVSTSLVYVGVGSADSASTDNTTVNGTDGIYAWGAQIEAGSYTTSYIPTTSASVTRLTDDVSLTSAAVSTIAPTSGVTMFIDFYLSQNQQTARFAVFDNAYSNYIFLGSQDLASNQSLRCDVRGGGVTFLSYAPSFTSVGRHKMAVKFLTSGIKVYLDGVEVASSGANAGFSASFQKIILGRDYPLAAGAVSTSMTNSIMIFPTALSDSDCISLTTL